MPRVEENERLTRVGPGTPMGNLMRRYWQPIATTGELAANPVLPVRILGENLTLFKDRKGRIGLIAQQCPHRLADLKLGIPREEGLMCAYHGWTFDTTGQCVDQPAENPESRFKEKVKVTSYPVEELGGLIWAYMGPEPRPLLPRWFPLVRENAYRQVGITLIPCNWLQCMENSVDSVHTEYLHGYLWEYVQERRGVFDPIKQEEIARFKKHHLKVAFEPIKYGITKRRLVEGDDETKASGWTIGNPLIFPYMVLIGSPGRYELQIRVPVDDEHTRHLSYQVFLPGPSVQVPRQDAVPTFDVSIEDLPDFVLGQDMIAWPTQGAIVDRSREWLGESDKGLILFRKMLEEQLRIVEDGGDPMNVFRDPAENQCIELPFPNYETPDQIQRYVKGSLVALTTGSHSPYLNDIESLMLQGVAAARAAARQEEASR